MGTKEEEEAKKLEDLQGRLDKRTAKLEKASDGALHEMLPSFHAARDEGFRCALRCSGSSTTYEASLDCVERCFGHINASNRAVHQSIMSISQVLEGCATDCVEKFRSDADRLEPCAIKCYDKAHASIPGTVKAGLQHLDEVRLNAMKQR